MANKEHPSDATWVACASSNGVGGVLQTFLHTSIHKFNTLGEFGYYQGVLPGIKAEGILSIIHKCAVSFSYCGLFAGITLREQGRRKMALK